MPDDLRSVARIIVAEARGRQWAWLRNLLGAEGYRVVQARDAAALLAAQRLEPAALVILGLLPTLEAGLDAAALIADEPCAPPLLLALDAPPDRELDLGNDLHHISDYILTSDPDQIVLNRVRRLVRHVAPIMAAGRDARSEPAPLIDVAARAAAEEEDRQGALAGALRDIAAALTSTLNPEAVLGLILEHVGRVVPHDAANIMQISGDEARVTHSRGYPPAIAQAMVEVRLGIEMPLLHRMIVTGKGCVVTDIELEPDWRTGCGYPGQRAYCAVPIRVYGQTVGFLNLDSATPGAFTAAHADRLLAFAHHAAIAFENAQLYDAIRRDMAELKTLQRATTFLLSSDLFTLNSIEDVGLYIAQTVVNEFGYADCGVMLLDSARGRLVRVARAGSYDVHATQTLYVTGPGLVPESLRTGQAIYAPDVRRDPRYIVSEPRTRSELVIPLRTTANGLIGVLDLQSARPDAFSEADQRLLLSFADQAAAAIENVRLYEQARRSNEDLEQRVAERTAELHRVKERAEAILNNSSDAIVLARADGAIQQTNRAFNLLFDHPVDAMFDRPLTALAHPESAESLRAALAEAVESRQPARIEIVAVNARDEAFNADVMVSPVQERDNRVLSVVCSLRDITLRKRAEEELRRALDREKELNELKSRFISTVSHEFRTPLAMIMTSSDLIRNYGHRLSEQQRNERLDKIQAEVLSLSALLDDLLTIGRASWPGKLDFQPALIDLAHDCRALVRDVETGIGADHHFVFVANGEPHLAWIDGKLLRRILSNLLSNAVKYSRPGATITVEIESAPGRHLLRVRDQGVGIPEEDRPNLFEAFYRARNVGHIMGTGLGLAIVKYAVELHGGTISLESGFGGSTFTIILPGIQPREDEHEENSGH